MKGATSRRVTLLQVFRNFHDLLHRFCHPLLFAEMFPASSARVLGRGAQNQLPTWQRGSEAANSGCPGSASHAWCFGGLARDPWWVVFSSPRSRRYQHFDLVTAAMFLLKFSSSLSSATGCENRRIHGFSSSPCKSNLRIQPSPGGGGGGGGQSLPPDGRRLYLLV